MKDIREAKVEEGGWKRDFNKHKEVINVTMQLLHL